MGNTVIVQRIKKSYDKPIDIAIKYYSIISVLNNIGLTDREIELMAHTAIKGTISTVVSKQEFIKNFGSSVATINNMISKLSKKKMFVKQNGKVRINPILNIDFNKPEFLFYINMKNNDTREVNQSVNKEDISKSENK